MLPDSYQLTTAPANLLIISMKEDHFVQILRNLAMAPLLLPTCYPIFISQLDQTEQ